MSDRIKDSTLATLRAVVDGDPYHRQFRPLLDEIDRLRRMLVGYVNHVSEFEGIDYLDRESEYLTQAEREEIVQILEDA
jgi:hypothetical protein